MQNSHLRKIMFWGAIILFALATLWINYVVKMNIQGGGRGGVVSAMGNVKIGQVAPDFSTLDLSNRTVSLSSYRGQKVVLLDFWATWCGPCRLEMISLQTLQEKYQNQGLEILSLNQGEDAELVRQFITRKKYGFHVLLDAAGAVNNLYGVRGIPTLVLVDKAGVIQRLEVGYAEDPSALGKKIETLLQK